MWQHHHTSMPIRQKGKQKNPTLPTCNTITKRHAASPWPAASSNQLAVEFYSTRHSIIFVCHNNLYRWHPKIYHKTTIINEQCFMGAKCFDYNRSSSSSEDSPRINLSKPCVPYTGRAYRYPPNVAIYIFFSTNISTEYFKHAAHSPFFSSKFRLFQNANFFGSCIIHILHTGFAKI
jgi:hypothetical protein